MFQASHCSSGEDFPFSWYCMLELGKWIAQERSQKSFNSLETIGLASLCHWNLSWSIIFPACLYKRRPSHTHTHTHSQTYACTHTALLSKVLVTCISRVGATILSPQLNMADTSPSLRFQRLVSTVGRREGEERDHESCCAKVGKPLVPIQPVPWMHS